MIFVVGGGGGLNPSKALIHVNAPVGSTVDFTLGGVIVKSIPPAKAFPNVDGETADYYLSVASSNYGSWTVTISLNGKTASETVTVNAAEQYDLVMDYNILLIRNGVLKESLHIDRPANYYTQESGYVHLSSTTQYVAVYSSENPIDFTRFNTLTLTTIGGGSGTVGGKCPILCIGSNRPTSPDGYASTIQNITAFTQLSQSGHTVLNNTYTLNISSYTGNYYIAIITAEDSMAYTQWLNVTEFGVKE